MTNIHFPTISTCFLLLFVLVCHGKDPLRFNSDGTFKIAQFTDLHFGEGESRSWGPIQDERSQKVMNTILDIEKPDLVILTGDMITGNNINDNATAYWREMVSPMLKHNTKWAFVFGNHDPLAKGSGGNRDDLMKYDMTFPLSYSQFGPNTIHGVSNYILEILSHNNNNNNNVEALLYMFDSNYESCDGSPTGSSCIYPDQVSWYSTQSSLYQQKYQRILPGLAFFHIPLQEYMDVWDYYPCYGYNNDSVACQGFNSGLFSAFLEQQDVQGVFVGHNHGNDYCGQYQASSNITLCFGRHTGYGGYGTWERGARIINLFDSSYSSPRAVQQNNKLVHHQMRNHISSDKIDDRDRKIIMERSSSPFFDTWIRFETGEKQTIGPLHNPSSTPQGRCSS